ncbi:sigma-70 family RNA polymerase sigma factor [Sphingobacterium sp. LRF_L2]|uniref:sigma-70 family RNA polymerase sigma factor n=1 Tax=Sphingobacterium sp. LRF_L2 TaxID=3369421 RepID=UPI003F640AAB
MDTFDKQISDLHAGRETALCFFMDQYGQALHFFAYKIIKDSAASSDIVSEAFVKLWERRTQFQRSESLRSFLYLVVKNDCLDHLKHSRQKYKHEEAATMDIASSDQDILKKIIYTELIELIVKEVRKLPKQQAAIFQLSIIEGKDTQEICEELGTTSNTVYFARSKAIAALKKVFIQKKLSLHHLTILLFLDIHQF